MVDALQILSVKGDQRVIEDVQFLVVDIPFPYNVIVERNTLNMHSSNEVSMYHLKLKFPTLVRTGGNIHKPANNEQ